MENFDKIHKNIQDLKKEKQLIVDILKKYHDQIDEIDLKIKHLTKQFPKCHSCWKHHNPKDMTIASQDDVDNYCDKNEGYCGPEMGEYYCGWC